MRVSSDRPMAMDEMEAVGKEELLISVTVGKLVLADATLNNRPEPEPTKIVEFSSVENGEYLNAENGTWLPVLRGTNVPVEFHDKSSIRSI